MIYYYRLTLQYKGTNYLGWQVQPEHAGSTVQGELNKALEVVSKSRAQSLGAGRTDAGVHALGQIAKVGIELSIDPKKSITYKRNENYWGKNLPVNKGRYNFDKITYEYYLDQNVLIESFKSGKLDFRYENIARNWANLYNVQNIINGKIIKKQIDHSMPAPTQAFILNLRKTKFQDKNFRMALNYAFNFE